MDLAAVKLLASETFGENFDVCVEPTPGCFQIGFKSNDKLDLEVLEDFKLLSGLKVEIGVFASIDTERWKVYGRLMLVATKETSK